MERRLAAILAADVVGSSRIIGVDEAGTLTALRDLKQDLVVPTLKSHSGRGVKLMGLIAILVFLLLTTGCTYDRGDPYGGRSMALIIVEDWKFRDEDWAQTVFSNTVERNAESFGKDVGDVGLVTGCIAGGAAGVTGGPPAMERGCFLVGFATGGVAYVVGFAIGAVVGTVEGAFTAFQNEPANVDAGALVAAFKESDPSAALETALAQATRYGTDASLTRLKGAQPAGDYGHLSGQGYPFVIVLKITEFYVSNYGVVSSGSRIHLAVKGEVIDTATNERQLVKDWTYTGEPVDPTKSTENESALLKTQMKTAWFEISSEIAWDIFFTKQLSGSPNLVTPMSATSTKPSLPGDCESDGREVSCPGISSGCPRPRANSWPLHEG